MTAVSRLYPGRKGHDVVADYIRAHPGCTRTQVQDATHLSATYLWGAERRGLVRRYGESPQRWEAVQ